MPVFTLTTAITLPRPIDEVFAFFSDAHNLEQITPAFLKFRVLTPPPIIMQDGTLLDYRLSLHGLPITWRTLISHWQPPFAFEDRQLRGPYRQWVHRHTFESVKGGTLCRDRVDYQVPGGKLVHRLFVQSDVRGIFEHRQNQLARILGQGGAVSIDRVRIDTDRSDAIDEPAWRSRQQLQHV